MKQRSRPNGPSTNRFLSSRQKERLPSILPTVLVCFLCSVVSFYAGICFSASIGWASCRQQNEHAAPSAANANAAANPNAAADSASVEKLKQAVRNLEQELENCTENTSTENTSNDGNNNNNNNEAQTQTIKPFHAEAFSKKHTGTFASGMQLVDRKEFAETFDTGVPLDQDTVGNNKVLLLYSDKSAFPDTHNNHNNNNNYHPTVREATANCNNLHVLLTQADSRTRQCIAVVGQYESYHVQKFMRVDPTLKKGGIDPSLPLSYVARGYQQNGRKSHKVPTLAQSKQHWKNLVEYLQTLLATNANNTTKGKGENSINTDGNGNSNSNVGVIESLTPVLKEVASHNDHNTVIVMVCNFGQSELLLNCKSRALAVYCVALRCVASRRVA
uniref:Transmembrane protein n=1 Tax=Pseudo-nitzschia australis TaxID=44445 RepID=A0A7S4ADT3_9STRA